MNRLYCVAFYCMGLTISLYYVICIINLTHQSQHWIIHISNLEVFTKFEIEEEEILHSSAQSQHKDWSFSLHADVRLKAFNLSPELTNSNEVAPFEQIHFLPGLTFFSNDFIICWCWMLEQLWVAFDEKPPRQHCFAGNDPHPGLPLPLQSTASNVFLQVSKCISPKN